MNRTSTRIAIAAAVTTLMVSSLAAGAVAQDEEEIRHRHVAGEQG